MENFKIYENTIVTCYLLLLICVNICIMPNQNSLHHCISPYTLTGLALGTPIQLVANTNQSSGVIATSGHLDVVKTDN